LDTNLQREEFCQKTLLDVFTITQRRNYALKGKNKDGVLVLLDLRDKQKNRPHAIGDETRQSVRNHIASFPKQSSHYSRSKSESECLSPDLTLQKVYNLYKEQNPETSVSKRMMIFLGLVLILDLVCHVLTHVNIAVNYIFNLLLEDSPKESSSSCKK
jgi:hypothetical protein